MGVRSRLAKVFGGAAPAQMQAGEEASGMTPASPFGPGAPIGPFDGYSRTPRSQNFVAGYNIAARPRSHERVAFETLRGLIDAYDVAQIAIWHRIDSIRALEWSLVAADGHTGDVADAVAIGMAALAKPDRSLPFASWLSAYLYDILAYDAGALYRMRNRAGRTVGLRTVDGTTLAPLLDDWGNPPEADAPSHVQYVNGLPWNWLTSKDLIYVPFRKVAGSPYGKAPLEAILLNANTDLRFQQHFLQRFTEGNIPAAFASAPDAWSPTQIEQFQEYWDAFILGDAAAKSQVKWIPAGSKIEFTNERDFSDEFSMFLMRKTFASFHVVPSDAGFTESVNKSSGETQSDVQHRIGDVPLATHVSGILTAFLQYDLGLPLKHKFDFGEEQDDRLQTAQADDLYIKSGVVGVSEIRELRFGLAEPGGKPIPRYVYTTRGGPIPLAALLAVSGPIDAESGAPALAAPLSHDAFRAVEGVLAVPPLESPPLAEQIYGLTAADDPNAIGSLSADVAKDGGGPTAGITTATGITSYDLVGHDEDDDEQEPLTLAPVAKASEVRAAELAAFRRYAKQRRRAGRPWRDFEFTAIDPTTAHRLNDGGRLAVRKAAGQIAVAGLAVRAADTGRVLMLQRALDDEDPAGGTFEFPGGHIEGSESPAEAAVREWMEETGLSLPNGGQSIGTWASPDGVYQGFAYQILREDDLDIFYRDWNSNPDDPDGDAIEALAWWDPFQLPGNPAVRPELLDSIDLVMAALGSELVKASGTTPPKVPPGPDWPGWKLDQQAADHWTRELSAALAATLTAAGTKRIADGWLAAHPDAHQPGTDRKALIASAQNHLDAQGIDLDTPTAAALHDIWTDGFLIGAASALAVTDGGTPQTGDWKPGDTRGAQNLIDDLGGAVALGALLGTAQGAVRSMSTTRLDAMAKALADAAMSDVGTDEAGLALRAALADASRSAAITSTEITRGSALGAFFGYRKRGVTMGHWVINAAKVCPRCLANAAAGEVPIGQLYPSGDAYPPAHPNCRCTVLPA